MVTPNILSGKFHWEKKMIEPEWKILRTEVPTWENQNSEVPVYELQELGNPELENPILEVPVLLIIYSIKYEK